MRYSGIVENDVVNTEHGFALSFFTQGCNHEPKCEGCFNPETWDKDGGLEKDDNELLNEILIKLRKNGIKRNLSILGGEPLAPYNFPFVIQLMKEVKEKYPETKIYLWTGYVFDSLAPSTQMILAQYCDTIIDGPYHKFERDLGLKLRGSHNQRILRKDVDF